MTGYTWLVARLPQRWALPIIQSAIAGVLLAFWFLFQTGAAWVSVAFYLMGLLMGLLLISQFIGLFNWSKTLLPRLETIERPNTDLHLSEAEVQQAYNRYTRRVRCPAARMGLTGPVPPVIRRRPPDSPAEFTSCRTCRMSC